MSTQDDKGNLRYVIESQGRMLPATSPTVGYHRRKMATQTAMYSILSDVGASAGCMRQNDVHLLYYLLCASLALQVYNTVRYCTNTTSARVYWCNRSNAFNAATLNFDTSKCYLLPSTSGTRRPRVGLEHRHLLSQLQEEILSISHSIGFLTSALDFKQANRV